MSKKVFCWLIVNTVFAVIVTESIIFIGNAFSARIDNETIKEVIFYAKTTLWVIIDLIFLFYFMVYWWSDRTWTKVKRKLSK